MLEWGLTVLGELLSCNVHMHQTEMESTGLQRHICRSHFFCTPAQLRCGVEISTTLQEKSSNCLKITMPVGPKSRLCFSFVVNRNLRIGEGILFLVRRILEQRIGFARTGNESRKWKRDVAISLVVRLSASIEYFHN